MATTRTRESHITAESDVPMTRVVREFDAPAAAVFRAHTDPELFAQWAGQRDLDTEIERFDCTTGGAYRLVQTGRDGLRYGFFGGFHEVRPDELIVQTFTFDAMPDCVALERMTFEDLGDGRSRLTATSLTESFATRDGLLAAGMEQGIREGYEKLDEVLARRSPS